MWKVIKPGPSSGMDRVMGIVLLTDELRTRLLAIDLLFQLGLSGQWQNREVREESGV